MKRSQSERKSLGSKARVRESRGMSAVVDDEDFEVPKSLPMVGGF